jgi:hypothetical protein
VSHEPSAPGLKPHHSEPVAGHGGTKFENVDAKPGLVIWSLAFIGGTLVIVFAMTIYFQRVLEKDNPTGQSPSPLTDQRPVPPAPQLQVHPWEELPEMRAHEDQVLSMTGKDADGHQHIPIDHAMDAVVAHLKIAPNAPEGLTVPGGNGREFSGSLADMPAQYRVPQIQGEVQKHAQ